MIDTSSKKIQVNQVVFNQLPSFVQEENPLFVDFLKTYYVGQENLGGALDISSNLNEYQKVETFSGNTNLIGFTTCTSKVNFFDSTINVTSTDGWPDSYGLLKINDEIISYTGKTNTSFTGCFRGFSGVESLHGNVNPDTLVFSETTAASHKKDTRVINLSNLFLQEFWKKTKELFLPGFEEREIVSSVDKANFLRQAKDFYSSKGTDEAVKILFGILYNKDVDVIKPIDYLIAPSDADFVATRDLVVESVSGDPSKVVGQPLKQVGNDFSEGSIFNVKTTDRNGKIYYTLSLAKSTLKGDFDITGSTRLSKNISIGSTVLNVDSTIGFPDSGTFYVGAGLTVGIATYKSKNSTQFFGVSGISSAHSDNTLVRSSNLVYSYEDGNLSKPVFFRLTAVINSTDIDEFSYFLENDSIFAKNLGNYSSNVDYRLNSWIHNIKTVSKVSVDVFKNESNIDLVTNTINTIDPHLLRIGDSVTLLDQTSNIASNVEATVTKVVNNNSFQIDIISGTLSVSRVYKVRKNLLFASSNNSFVKTSDFISNVQNTYTDKSDENVYVASGSLPSFKIYATDRRKTFSSSDISSNSITISNHGFLTGELVNYKPTGIGLTVVTGLSTNTTYAVVKIDDNTIKLARSAGDALVKRFLDISSGGTTHLVVPEKLSGKKLQHQNFLRKFPRNYTIPEYRKPLENESIGMFLNGTEIMSNRSGDSIWYGPITGVEVQNGGSGYDVKFPPNINISDITGVGATAYAIVENGKFEKIEILSGGFDIQKPPVISITGGNGSGATAETRIRREQTTRTFDPDSGVNTSTNTITFPNRHLFDNGEEVFYQKATGFAAVGGLVDKSIYYLHVKDDYSVQFMSSYDDAVNGINPINLTSASAGVNTVKTTKYRGVLDSVVITNSGSGYSNRRVVVTNSTYPPIDYTTIGDINSGISTSNDYVFFKNHGFRTGDLVEYKSDSPISGLSTVQNYYVVRVDEDKFKLTSAGIGTTSTTSFLNKQEFINLKSVGGSTHTFKYPDIHISVDVVSGVANTAYSTPSLRPVCVGEITQCPLTSVGSGYGATDCINVHRKPNVTVSNGSGAIIDIVVDNGQIVNAFVKSGGGGYQTPPKITVSGEGKYAKLVANVSNGVVTSVTISDTGKDYVQSTTSVVVRPAGSGVKLDGKVKEWKLTTLKKYRPAINENDDGILVQSQNENYGLKYINTYLPRQLRLILEDNIEDDFSEKSTVAHSPIVGWAYDGSPIYGPYGYGTPSGGTVRRMVSGYKLVNKGNRPSTSIFPYGSFIEDYVYNASGDLDEFNGRFCRTPEYPDGVYAYFCTIQATNSSISPFANTREPEFPYVLNGFKYKRDQFNESAVSIQNLPLVNSSDLVRNTYYYKLGFSNSEYNYLVTDQLKDSELIVRSIENGGINTVSVILPGQNYKVNEQIRFNNLNSFGNGAAAKVRNLVGKGLSTLSYNIKTVPNVSFVYSNDVVTGIATTAHGLKNNDLIVISGVGTGQLSFIEGSRTISVSTVTSKLDSGLLTIAETGITTTITLQQSPNNDAIQVDDIIGIGTERLSILFIDRPKNLYRVRRQAGFAGSHFQGSPVSLDQRTFSFEVGLKTDLSTPKNSKIVFNPQSTIGFGTAEVVKTVVGIGTTIVVRVKAKDGTILSDHQLPPPGSTADNAITITNHNFVTGQAIKYNVGPTGFGMTVANDLALSDTFQLVDDQIVYAVKKSNNLLGISTTLSGIGSTTTSLYFSNIGSDVDHSFTTTEIEYVGTVKRYDVTAKVTQPHVLNTGDKVKVNVLPNKTISTEIEYDLLSRKTITTPTYLSSSSSVIGVGSTNSVITSSSHGFVSGDKIVYRSGSSVVTPLVDGGEYYIKKINDDKFRLSTNYSDSTTPGGSYIGINSFGSGVHKIAKINPHIVAVRGNSIGFAVSDNSLTDLKLEFFEDQNFVTRFEGVGISTEIIRSGTPGTPGAKVTLKLSENTPTPLYYKLTPTNLTTIDSQRREAGPDNSVKSGSKIIVTPSTYSGTFSITTTSNSTEFVYQTAEKPEFTPYTTSGITTFNYTTNSKTATGGIHDIFVTFPGVNYKQNPGISTIVTTSGENALLRIYDNGIGKPNNVDLIRIGYDYPSDKSIQPTVDIPTVITISNNFAMSQVGVLTAGRNYVTAPDLIIPGRDDVVLTATLSGTGIGQVTVETAGRGFNEVPTPPRIVAINNTNGIGIVSTSSNGDTNFVTLEQPTNGWKSDGSDFPFSVGDRIFVEGVGTAQTTFSSTGGYNSENYDYTFFTVKTRNPSSSQITYSIAGLGTTGGTYNPDTSAGRVIRQKDLPTFTALLIPEPFFDGEGLTYGANGKAFVLANSGFNPVTNTLRIRSTTSEIKIGDVIKGQLSSAQATVRNVISRKSFFKTDYFADRVQGWKKDTGKLNDDYQKITDSDYYQAFSYSLKSEVPYDTWKTSVDSLVHTTGYKNFSDLIIRSNSTAGFARSNDLRTKELKSDTSLTVNVDNEESFFTKTDFDLAGEETIKTFLKGVERETSKFITLQNKKITSFINIITNKVDLIDDISPQFTGIGTTTSAKYVGLTSFKLLSDGIPLFTKVFDGSDSDVISVGSSLLRINNHNFQTGERVKYDPSGAYGNNRIGIDTTNVVLGGVSTNFLPSEVYVIKVNNNFLSLAGLATAAASGNALSFRSVGSGTSHSLDVLRPDDRVIIEIDEIIQPPLFRRTVDVALDEAVGVGSTTIKVVGVTSISVNNLLNIDNEIMRISTVGLGSTNVLEVERGVLGSVAAAHTVGAAVTMRGGSFHIVKDVIHFVTPPYGKVGVTTLQPGIGTNSTFQGRVFNRKDPTTNFIFDDISQNFSGIGKTFTLLQDSQDVTGIVTTVGGGGEVVNQGIILINNMNQRPLIDFVMQERLDPGIGASVIFTGTNRENLPRGGIVENYTIGFGTNYQPLVAAAATAIINGAGAIESVIVTGGGSGYRSAPIDIQVFNPLGIGSTAVLQATVGSAGTITGITTVSGGSGYASTTPPFIVVGLGTGYEKMTYSGGSGSGFKASVVVGTGGSIVDFKVDDAGIGYQNGEVLTVVGIPTGSGGFSPHTITVTSIYNDSFAGFSFGQLLELDSFEDQFDGSQTTFTLTKTTINKDIINIGSNDTTVKPANNLLVFINDILQQPGQAYEFNGGTQMTFTEPPKAGSKLQLLFFRGSNSDVDDGTPFATIKVGDTLQLERKVNSLQQKERKVTSITGVQKVQTNLYSGAGINPDRSFVRPLTWTKQKSDLILNNQALSKSRTNYSSNIVPTTNIIQNVGLTSNFFYVIDVFPIFSALDNRSTRNEVPGDFGVDIIAQNNVDRADATVSVSVGGTIVSPVVTDNGSGYINPPTVSFASSVAQIREIGRTWTQRTSYTDVNYQGIERFNGMFVAVGSTTGINTSTSGVSWSNSPNSTTFGDLNAIVGMTTHLVVVGASGTCGFSTDGLTFSPSTTFRRRNVFPLIFWDNITVSQNINDVAFGNNIGVAVGAAGTIMFTVSGYAGFGTAFEVTTKQSSQNLNGVSANGNVFVTVGDNGTILRSTNGQTFSGVSTSSITTKLNGIKYADGKWIGVGVGGTIIKSVNNGLTWSVVSAGSTFDLNNIDFRDNVWVAIGQSGMVLNSTDTNTWYKKHIGSGNDFNDTAFGDNKLIAVGLSSSIYSSEFETVSAAGTATISNGQVTGINIDEPGFGYNPNANVEVLIDTEPVTKETILSVSVEGDYGDVVSVATSSTGIGTDKPMVIFELDSDSYLDQAAFNNITKSGINTGDYYTISNSFVGNACTSITISDQVIGIGTTFLDNVYKADFVSSSNSGIVTVYSNVRSITGIATTSFTPRIGKYSWGRVYNFSRDSLNPRAFVAQTTNGFAGLSTSPVVQRNLPLRQNWSDLDQTT